MLRDIKVKSVDALISGLLIAAGLFIFADLAMMGTRNMVPYSEFKSVLATNGFSEVVLEPDYLVGKRPDGGSLITRAVPSDPSLYQQLDAAEVKYGAASPWRTVFYGYGAPLLLLGACLYLYQKRRSTTLRGFGGRSKSILVPSHQTVTFEDVAGCSEAKQDLVEIVDFLRHPEIYHEMGAKLPSGVLLSGPPGTGKTLLARALAGEADVPFYSLSGSDFVEMYVGVGAKRIRELFRIARQHTPAIIFIDELDALGKKRDDRGVGNDERENTLNQLLVELDGFGAREALVVVGSTNRPDIIDSALVRPGRFDRQITVDIPDREGRLAILEVHCQARKLCSDTTLDMLAGATSGMSGAELANIVNEASLLAVRERAECISGAHFSEAMERVIAGPIRTSRILNDALRRRIAYHEVGHALVASFSETADQVKKVSIVPRGKAALGYTLQLPATDSYLMTEQELRDRIKVLLAGRAAEKLIFGNFSTGAENDLIRATQIARRMIGHFGMSGTVSPLHFGPTFDEVSTASRDLLEDEAGKILIQLQSEATAILEQHSDLLEVVTRELLSKETLDADELNTLLEGRLPVSNIQVDT